MRSSSSYIFVFRLQVRRHKQRVAEAADEEKRRLEGMDNQRSNEEKRKRRAADRTAELTIDKIPDEHWDSDADENIEVDFAILFLHYFVFLLAKRIPKFCTPRSSFIF
jgi:hypothetical protein